MSADVEITHALQELGAATLGESGGRAMRARIRAVWPGARLAAPAYPVRCTPGDNLGIHVAVARAQAGDALVVDVGDFRELGYWGEVLTTGAQARGIAGLIIDGGVRDITEIQAHGFPVFSTMVALRGAAKTRPGTVRAPIQCGGVLVEPGDWVVADADGVVVVPSATIADVINAGRVRAAKEAAMFRALWEGKTTLELLDLDPSPIQEGETP
ncbi:MAG TPA: dimethylmenaquinone methyltransferase [Acidimicrobiia bacterium]|jgi:4-hydroxy-4-methyl-2-oxoglutarate aldolase